MPIPTSTYWDDLADREQAMAEAEPLVCECCGRECELEYLGVGCCGSRPCFSFIELERTEEMDAAFGEAIACREQLEPVAGVPAPEPLTPFAAVLMASIVWEASRRRGAV